MDTIDTTRLERLVALFEAKRDDEVINLLYMWVKTGTINRVTFAKFYRMLMDIYEKMS